MSNFNTVFLYIIPFLPIVSTSIIVVLMLWGANQLLIVKHPELGNERMFPRQLIMLGLTFAGILAIALALPVSENSRNQIIVIIGLIISGVFAFSSNTIFANLMAGLMLRVTKPFRAGDFIKINENFGRVVERGLFDTEIQTENRELLAIPNTFMIKNPVYVTHSSGTIVSTTLSLGYDIHHSMIDSMLLDAAIKCGLKEPFVQILELGDYSITYKVSGMLEDVKSLLTARSNLCRYVLDTLHENRVEIVSPTFMNQRPILEDKKIIPAKAKQKSSESISIVEEIVFDKAEKAEKIENEKLLLLNNIQQYEEELKEASTEEKKQIQVKIKEDSEKIKNLENSGVESD
ncbi:MAG: mechanosensitive ion channel [Proteobacteria bacterium]|nr:mechanosensitive ion channel [Pseudomonadota bacterium]